MCRQDPKAVTHPAQTHTSLTTQAHVAFSLSTTSTFVGTSCPISHFCLTPSSQTTCFAPGLFERRLARGVDLKDPHIDGHELRRSIIWSRWSDILIASRKELRSKRKVAPHLSGEGCYIFQIVSPSASFSSSSFFRRHPSPGTSTASARTTTAHNHSSIVPCPARVGIWRFAVVTCGGTHDMCHHLTWGSQVPSCVDRSPHVTPSNSIATPILGREMTGGLGGWTWVSLTRERPRDFCGAVGLSRWCCSTRGGLGPNA